MHVVETLEWLVTRVLNHGDASSVALVGYEPYLSMLAEHLLGVAPNEGVVIEFKKGAIATFRLALVDQPALPDGVHVPQQHLGAPLSQARWTPGRLSHAPPPDGRPPCSRFFRRLCFGTSIKRFRNLG